MSRDRFGLLMRPAFVREIRERLESVDVLQLITDDWIGAPALWLDALRELSVVVPFHLHGVSLGLASVAPLAPARLDPIARVIEALRPERWSEHLALVRVGRDEGSVLSVPPRTSATVEAAIRNLEVARSVVGSTPEVENVARRLELVGSSMTESEWIRSVAWAGGAPLLLDLHNLYSTWIHLGLDPTSALNELPLDRVATLHVAGGRKARTPSGALRMLGDHSQPVPSEIHELLYEFGRRTIQPVDVILEREVLVPHLDLLLDELDALRASLARGRAEGRIGIAS